MVQIPTTFQRSVPQAPGPAPQPDLGRAPTQASEALGELGGQLNELGNRLFEQQVQEQSAQAELQAQQELAQLETQALESPDFRNAPEQFREQARQRINNIAENVNPTVQDRVRTRLFRQAATQTAQLRRRAVRKSQDATEAAVNNQLQSLAEGFAKSPTPQGRQVIEDQINETADKLRQSAILTGPEVEAKAAETRAIAQAARVTQLVNEKNPDAARTALQNGPDIAPDQAFTLNNRIEATENEVEREFGDMIAEVRAGVAGSGRIPRVLSNGVRFEDLEERVQGTKFSQEIRSIKANVEAIRGHQSKPLPQQRRALRDLGRRAAEDRRLARRFELLKDVTTQQRKGFEDDPYQTGTDVGLIQGPPAIPIGAALQGTEEGQQNLTAALRQRMQARQTLVDHTGSNIPLLREEEKTALEQAVQTVPAEQAVGVLRSMGRAMGVSSARRMAEDLAEKDELVGTATLLAPDAPEVATRILSARGAADTDVKLTETDARTTFNDVVGGALGQNAEMRSAMRSSTDAVYKRLVLERGRDTDTFHDDLFRQAAQTVTFGRRSNEGTITGGPVEINGRKTLPPRPGEPRENVQEAFEALAGESSNELVQRHGIGVPARRTPDGDFEQVDTQTFAEAQPRYVGDGQYTFQLPSDNGFIHAVDPESGQPTGRPFVFDMRGALENGDIQPGARLEGTIDVLGVELDVQGRQGPPEIEGGRPEGPGPAGPGRRGGERARQEGNVSVGRPQPAGDAGDAGGAGPGGRGLGGDDGEVSGGSGPGGRGLGGGARQDQLQPQPGVTEQTGRVSGSRSLFEPAAQQQGTDGGTPPTPGTRPVTTPTPEFNPFRSSEAPLRARDNTVPKPPPEPDAADLSVPKPRRGQGLQQLVALAPDLQVTGDGELQVPDAVVQAEIEPPRAPNAEGRGISNNNPMNLAFSGNDWLGKGPPDQENLTDEMPEAGFETFRNPVLGVRAGAQDLLASQLQKDQRTLRGIMREFTQTDRESYVSFLSDRLGVSPTDRIDLTNPNTLVETVKGIIEFENGVQPYKESTIATGVAMGFSAKKEAGQF